MRLSGAGEAERGSVM
ncbi:hypothetical protein MPL3356_340059 [Mesorhizobium plurifarium]|uniref:Uncharacterized protein n=1 Tax=Mesorhizobium plurifarium TaxID=69974 RepID=A0A090E262_MESPL|nr:hypothetical protein MPL3356_340059 [Mesorhizobium plurifarium]